MNTNIGISKSKEITQILEIILATESVLNLKIRKYHWNIEGSHFQEYHSYLGDLYEASADSIDDIAERIRMLGEFSPASFAEYLKLSIITEDVEKYGESNKMLQTLLSDKEIMINLLRDSITKIGDYNDVGTEDFLTGLIQNQEKDAWMIRSMIK